MVVSSDGAALMRFACREEDIPASEWFYYSENFSSFDITTGPGCNQSEGWKTVFVEFMDDVGNIQLNHVNASVFLDLTPPRTFTSNDEEITTSTITTDSKTKLKTTSVSLT